MPSSFELTENLTPANIGGPAGEFRSALQSCVVIDQPRRVRLRIAGSDAQRWLNGMLTNTAALAEGHGNYSFLLNAQGRIQGDAYLFRQGEGYVLETSVDQQEKLTQWFDRFIIMDDVTVVPDQALAATLLLAGPTGSHVLTSFGFDSEALLPLQLAACKIAKCEVRIVRMDVGCVPTFALWHEASDGSALSHALIEAGATIAGDEINELLRIAAGTPLYGVDLLERDLPQETGQQRALHFSKGCYIGQEIVERIHSRGNVHRGLRGFIAQTAISPGATIVANDKEIGALTSTASLPLRTETLHVGIGIVRLQTLAESVPLQAAEIAIHPANIPFV